MPAALIWAFKAVKGHIKRQLFLIILEIYIRRLGNIPNKAKCCQTLSILKQYDGGPVPLCQFGRKCFYPQIAEGPLGRFVCLWEPLSGSENFPRMIGINLEQMVIIMVHSHTLAGTLGGNLAQEGSVLADWSPHILAIWNQGIWNRSWQNYILYMISFGMKNVTRSRMYRGRIWCDGCALLKVMRERYLWIGLNSLAESSVWGRNSIKATEH